MVKIYLWGWFKEIVSIRKLKKDQYQEELKEILAEINIGKINYLKFLNDGNIRRDCFIYFFYCEK